MRITTHENIELHNTVELEDAAGGGLHLRRIPKAVRDCLSPLGRMVADESAGCELRFVTEAESLRVAVSSMPSTLAPWELHNQEAFNQILRDLVEELRSPHLNLIEGADILTDYTGITKDLIHPGDYGHAEMGLNLARTIAASL